MRQLFRILCAGLVLVLSFAVLTGPAARAPRQVHHVEWDHYSLAVDGKRILLRSTEFHYFRLPSTALWRDILEKEKAAGFNAVSLYFDWAYHSAAPGEYDFSGVRNVDLLLTMAQQAGLYVIARPGPYLNAELSGGGFPSWLKTVPGKARSSSAGYTAAYRDWLAHLDPIIARHQITRGGPVLLYQAENEYAMNTDAAYMRQLQGFARADGIDVPITTNVCCSAAPGNVRWASGEGSVQIPTVDDYPMGFDCTDPEKAWATAGKGVTKRIRNDTPVIAGEYQSGSIDEKNAGYAACRSMTGPDFMRVFQKTNLMTSGATGFNYYLGFVARTGAGRRSRNWSTRPTTTAPRSPRAGN